MNSAFKNFGSALAVLAGCYLLAIASWQLVLILFLAASFGWCFWSCKRERSGDLALRRRTQIKPETPSKPIVLAETSQFPKAVLLRSNRKSSKVYNFPMHQLSRTDS